MAWCGMCLCNSMSIHSQSRASRMPKMQAKTRGTNSKSVRIYLYILLPLVFMYIIQSIFAIPCGTAAFTFVVTFIYQITGILLQTAKTANKWGDPADNWTSPIMFYGFLVNTYRALLSKMAEGRVNGSKRKALCAVFGPNVIDNLSPKLRYRLSKDSMHILVHSVLSSFMICGIINTHGGSEVMPWTVFAVLAAAILYKLNSEVKKHSWESSSSSSSQPQQSQPPQPGDNSNSEPSASVVSGAECVDIPKFWCLVQILVHWYCILMC